MKETLWFGVPFLGKIMDCYRELFVIWYGDIMGDLMESFANDNLLLLCTFMHNNDPKYASKVVQN